ncbi:MAG: hypothetical protein JKY94_01955 [Rhodobacteraceae bacterium]|nr:hypothetical protein [Paracoccaceae bacterium]
MGDVFDTLITGGLAFLSDREESRRREAEAQVVAVASNNVAVAQGEIITLVVGAGVLIAALFFFTR